MKMRGWFLLIIALNIAAAGQAIGLQPYEEDFVVTRQADNQCGPNTVYMIMRHYGHLATYWDLKNDTAVDLSRDFNTGNPSDVLGADTDIAEYINGSGTLGTSWKQMEAALQNLHVVDSATAVPVMGGARYGNIDGESLLMINGSAGDSNGDLHGFTYLAEDEARSQRLDYIFENYLALNRPVICHLHARRAPGFGHYIVLTGWDKASDTIHWADSLSGENKTCTHEEFISDYFFKSGLFLYYRWDGEWLGFFE